MDLATKKELNEFVSEVGYHPQANIELNEEIANGWRKKIDKYIQEKGNLKILSNFGAAFFLPPRCLCV